MYIIPISDDNVQTFGFNMDIYPSRMTIKCPQIDCGVGEQYPVLDLFVENYAPIYGIPMVPNTDLLAPYIRGGCLPLDLGALFVLPDADGLAGCEQLADSTAVLSYIGGPEVAFLSLYN